MFQLPILFVCLIFNCVINAQFLNYNPDQNANNLMNTATEALNGGNKLFNYEWRNQNPDKANNYEQLQTNYQQQAVNYQPQDNYIQPRNNFQKPSSCCRYFSYQTEQNEIFAIVTLPNPNYVRNELKVQMTLAAQVSVRNSIIVKIILCLDKPSVIQSKFRKFS